MNDLTVEDHPDVVSFGVEIADDILDHSSFPIFKIRVENISDDTIEYWHDGPLPIENGMIQLAFPGWVTRPPAFHIGLVEEIENHLGEITEDDSSGATIRLDERFWRLDVRITVSLEPGEAIEQAYGIIPVDVELNGDNPEPGVYHALSEYGDLGEWGFKFHLEEI